MSSYHDELKALAESIGSDGCTSALQINVECCWEHDASYYFGVTPRGVPITKADADQRFRDCIQAHSSFRYLSPMSWWRWAAVSLFGRGIWASTPTRTLGLMDASALDEARAAREAIIAEIASR